MRFWGTLEKLFYINLPGNETGKHLSIHSQAHWKPTCALSNVNTIKNLIKSKRPQASECVQTVLSMWKQVEFNPPLIGIIKITFTKLIAIIWSTRGCVYIFY